MATEHTPGRPPEAGEDAQYPANNELALKLYNELRGIARAMMRDEKRGHTLQPTAVVHEAWLRLSREGVGPDGDRLGFLRLAAREMRRVLVDHARKRGASRRGRGWKRLPMSRLTIVADRAGMAPLDLLALDEALLELGRIDPVKVEIIELSFFAGMSQEEIAEVLGVPLRTVQRKWAVARSRVYMLLSEMDTKDASSRAPEDGQP